jgi:hypothetical protein
MGIRRSFSKATYRHALCRRQGSAALTREALFVWFWLDSFLIFYPATS